MVLAGNYTVQEETSNGVTIRVATYALDNPRAVKQLTNLAANIISTTRSSWDRFRFREFNIIEINYIGCGPGASRDDVHHQGGLQPDHGGDEQTRSPAA